MTGRVYLDNHATTRMDPRVLESMLPYLTECFGNPGSIGHVYGEEARLAVDQSRRSIADQLNVSPHEIVFTSGATESNNLAIRGLAERFRQEPNPSHFVSLTTEHKAVLDPLTRLEQRGQLVTLVRPQQVSEATPGLVDLQCVADAIRDETRLVSIMLANNEIGVIQPIRELADICHARGTLLHCDATQAVGKIPMDIDALGVDMLSFSGHKIYGPRGIGVLVVRRRRPRIRLTALQDGGGQEEGRRSGTLNVPAIVGLARAVTLCVDELSESQTRIAELRESLFQQISGQIDGVKLNGPGWEHRLSGNLNLHFGDVDGEALMMNMSQVAVSSGSACTSANPEPSHVLRAIGLSEDETRSSLRFGIGRFNTEADIACAAGTLVDAVRRLRALN